MGSRNEERGAARHPVSRTPVTTHRFDEDLDYWAAHSPVVAERLARIMDEILRAPFEGIGKPEALRHGLRGHWSRRLTQEHRIIYRVTQTTVEFLSARHHY